MKKLWTLMFVILLSAYAVSAQTEHYLSIGISAGAGYTFQNIGFGSTKHYPLYGNPTVSPGYRIYNYGYHIPVNLTPIMYGTTRWRIGAMATCEYLKQLETKYPDFTFSLTNPRPIVFKTSISYVFLRAGGLFEYDFFIKKKWALGLASEFGYFSLVGAAINGDQYAQPYLYANLGLHASYSFSKGWKMLYGAGFEVQGTKVQVNDRVPDAKLTDNIFYQPNVTIGIRKDFLLKAEVQK